MCLRIYMKKAFGEYNASTQFCNLAWLYTINGVTTQIEKSFRSE